MWPKAKWMGVFLAAGLMSGCVERSYVVETNPPGAFVQVNNQPLGPSPVDGSFIYYGNYEFKIIKEGYETQVVQQEIPLPWYEYWPMEFFVENLWPFKIRDQHRFRYDLVPLQVPNSEEILRRSEELRTRGQSIRPPITEAPSPLPNPYPNELPKSPNDEPAR